VPGVKRDSAEQEPRSGDAGCLCERWSPRSYPLSWNHTEAAGRGAMGGPSERPFKGGLAGWLYAHRTGIAASGPIYLLVDGLTCVVRLYACDMDHVQEKSRHGNITVSKRQARGALFASEASLCRCAISSGLGSCMSRWPQSSVCQATSETMQQTSLCFFLIFSPCIMHLPTPQRPARWRGCINERANIAQQASKAKEKPPTRLVHDLPRPRIPWD
jgi:hypothetical protein